MLHKINEETITKLQKSVFLNSRIKKKTYNGRGRGEL